MKFSKKNVAILSPFPKKNEFNTSFSALGKYTLMIVSTFDNEYKKKSIIISQKNFNDDLPHLREGIEILPLWKINDFLLTPKIIKYVIKENISLVHIQHEIFAYGNIISAFSILLLSLLLRLINKKIVITFHSVIPLSDLNKKYLHENGIRIPSIFVRFGFYIIFKVISTLSNEIIVHTKTLKSILVNEYKISRKKISIIPMPLFEFVKHHTFSKKLNQLVNRKDKVILFFGYLAQYKGLESLIDSMKYFDLKRHRCKLIIAGDSTPRHKENKNYINWLNSLKSKSKKISDNIIWDHRFIPENEIKSYFDKANILVVPYPKQISFSGPITFAINNKTPFIVNSSFKDSLDDALIYGSTATDLSKTLINFFSSSKFRKAIKIKITEYKDNWNKKSIFEKTKKIYEKNFK